MKTFGGLGDWFFAVLVCAILPCPGQVVQLSQASERSDSSPQRWPEVVQSLAWFDSNKAEPAGTRDRAASEPEAREFIYKKTPQGDLKIHVHFPPRWKSSDQRPAMIFFFGGAWSQGSVTQFLRQAEYFAGRGMVTARADYRVASRHGTLPDKCVEDARSAIRWLRLRSRELGIDPNRIVGSGGSAGGHIAACAALARGPDDEKDDLRVSCRPNALVLFNPVVDLDGVRQKILDASGRNVTELLSPILSLNSSAPTAILFYGTNDRFLEQGLRFRARAKELGLRAEVYTALDQPHGFFNRTPWQEVTMRRADEFLASLGYVKGPPTIELPAGAPELKPAK